MFDIQGFLRSLKEFDAIKSSDFSSSSNLPFIESELLDKRKKIRVSLSLIFSQIISEISNFSIEMNSSISDINIGENFVIDGDDKYTSSTWSGRGDKINKDIQLCLDSISELLGSESSTSSSFDFSDKILSIIYSGLFGKYFDILEYSYIDEEGNNLFGKFDKLFKFSVERYRWQYLDGYLWRTITYNDIEYSKPYLNFNDFPYLIIQNKIPKIRLSIKFANKSDFVLVKEYESQEYIKSIIYNSPNFLAGLSFLLRFSKIKSYRKNLYEEFKNGIIFNPPDLFSSSSSYQESFSEYTKYLLGYTKNLTLKVKKIKTLLDSITSNCDSFGRYQGYEGLGNIKGQIDNLRKLFKTEYLDSFSKRISSDLLKITSFSNSGSQEILNSISSSLIKLSSNLESLSHSLIRIGIKDGEEIIDRSYIYGSNTRDEIVSQLKKLGFTPQQINTILSSKDLSCSFSFLYDSLDEKDIYSYFKGGRLAEYIFYLGGESAISQTLDFLISKKDIKYLFEILEKLQKNKDFTLSENRYIYGNILGSFISIFPESINYLPKVDFEFYEKEIITDLISSGTISRTSNDILSLVEKRISDYKDISYQEILNYPLILKTFLYLLTPAIKDFEEKYKNPNFLSSLKGLSAKELNIVLGGIEGNRSYELSGFLSGIEGGRYQSLVSGLIHGVLLPKNSPVFLPANRRKFILGEKRNNASLEELVYSMVDFSKDIRYLSETLLNIDSGPQVINSEPKLLTSTIYSINKDISYTINNLSSLGNSEFISSLRQALDAEKPGIGNSPKIDSSQKRGVLNPSQSREIEFLLGKSNSQTKSNLSNLVSYEKRIILEKDILSRWIKLDFSSLNLLNSISKIEEGSFNSNSETLSNFIKIKEKLTELINEGFINLEKNNYLNIISVPETKLARIDDIKICSKLGKSQKLCEKEYSEKKKISSDFGKTLKPSSIPIERPLGVISENYFQYSNSPGPKLLESLSQGKIKAYEMDISSITEYTSSVDILPSITFNKNFPKKEVLNQEERNISSSLYDLSNHHLYVEKYSKYSKPSVNDCRLLSDPIEKNLCLNYVKCIKFRPNLITKYLTYCPISTPGGRNKIYES